MSKEREKIAAPSSLNEWAEQWTSTAKPISREDKTLLEQSITKGNECMRTKKTATISTEFCSLSGVMKKRKGVSVNVDGWLRVAVLDRYVGQDAVKFYFQSLRDSMTNEQRATTLLVNPYFCTILQHRPLSSITEKDMQQFVFAQDKTKQRNKWTKIIFPWVQGGHYYAFFAYLQSNRIEWCDSFNAISKTINNASGIIEYLIDKYIPPEGKKTSRDWTLRQLKSPQQSSGVDCAFFVCFNVTAVVNNIEPTQYMPSVAAVQAGRERFAVYMMKKSLYYKGGKLNSLWTAIDRVYNERRKLIFSNSYQPAPGDSEPSAACPTIDVPKQIPAKYSPNDTKLHAPVRKLMTELLLRCRYLRDKIHAFHDVLPFVFKPYYDDKTMLDTHRSVVLAFIVNEMTLIRQGIMQLTNGATYNGDKTGPSLFLARDHLRNDLDNAKTFWKDKYGVNKIQDALTKNIIKFGYSIGDALTQFEDARNALERAITMKCILECNQTTLHYTANSGRSRSVPGVSFDATKHSTSSTIPPVAQNNNYTSMKFDMMRNLLRRCYEADGHAPQPIVSHFDGSNEQFRGGACYIDRNDYPPEDAGDKKHDALKPTAAPKKKRKTIKYDSDEEDNDRDILGHLLSTPPKSSSTEVATTTTKESNEKNEKSAAGSETTLTNRLDNTGGGGADVDKKLSSLTDRHDNDDDFATTATVAETAVAPKKKRINDAAAAPEATGGSKNSSGEDVGGDDDNDDDQAATTATTTNKKRMNVDVLDENNSDSAAAPEATGGSKNSSGEDVGGDDDNDDDQATTTATTTKKKRKNDDVSDEHNRKVNSDSAAAPEVTGGSKNSSGEDVSGDDDNDDDQAATTATTTKKKRKNDDVSDEDDLNMNGDPAAAPTGTGGSNSSGNVETRRSSARLKGSAGTSGGDNEENNDNDDDAEPSSNGNDVDEDRKDDANSTTTVCCANDNCVLNSETIDDAATTCNNCSGKAHGKCVQDWDNGQLAKIFLTAAGKRVFVEIQKGDTSGHKICLGCFERAKKKQKESKRLKAGQATEQKKLTQSQIVDGTNIKKGPKDATSLPTSLPTKDEDSNETVKSSKRDGKSLARFSLNDTWRRNDFQYDSFQTMSNRKSTAKANNFDWTKSFKSEKNQHHTVVPEDECSLDANKTVYFNVGNDQVCKGNEYPLHTTTANDNQCENMLTSLTEKSDALRRSLPKSELRGVDIRRNSSFEPATLFIDSAVDCIEMVDHIQKTKDVGKVFLHPNIMRSPKFFQTCIQQIPEWKNEKDTEGVYFLGFVRMWVKDDVVIKFFIDAGLLFSIDASQEDGLSRVNFLREHTHPVFCGSGMVKRLMQIAMLGFGFDAMMVEGRNVLLTPDTCKAIAGRLECSEGPNGSSPPSKKLVDETIKITTTVVLSLPEVLDSPFESSCTTSSPNGLTDEHVATLTAIPFSVIVHALRLLLTKNKVKLTTSAIDANITETLCEIYQWTEVCPLGYSKLKPFYLECRLRCSCCGQFFGQKSSLFNLLHSAPELIANHHGVTDVTLPGFGRVSQSSCVDENKCRFGNGLFQPGQNNNSNNCEDVLLDITKRRNLADAIRTDRLNCKNNMMNTCVLFDLLHKDIPDQGKEIHTNNVIEMEPYNVTNINNHQQWKQNESLSKKAAIAFLVAGEARLKCAVLSLMGDKWNETVLSRFGMTTQFVDLTQRSKFMSSPGQLVAMYNPKKRLLPDELLLTKILKSRPNWCTLFDYSFGDHLSDSKLKPHSSWSDDKSDPSEIALSVATDGDSDPSASAPTAVAWKKPGVKTLLQCQKDLVSFAYADKIFRIDPSNWRNKVLPKTTPEIVKDLLRGYPNVVGNVFVLQCNFDQRGIASQLLDVIKKADAKFFDAEKCYFPSKLFLQLFGKKDLAKLPEAKWSNIEEYVLLQTREAIRVALHHQIQSIRLASLYPNHIFEVSLLGEKKTKFVSSNNLVPSQIINEPWLLETLTSLPYVGTNSWLRLGEGKRSRSITSNSACKPRMPGKQNLWVDKINNERSCVQGCLVNLFHAMGLHGEAVTLKNECLTDVDVSMDRIDVILSYIKEEFGVESVELTVNISSAMISTATSVVDYLSKISVPFLLCLKGTSSIYTHVVAVWKGEVYDLESDSPFLLNAINLMESCGDNEPLVQVRRLICLTSQERDRIQQGFHSNVGLISCQHFFLRKGTKQKRKQAKKMKKKYKKRRKTEQKV